jgi:UDP-N-acetylglucosamine 2-epimerase (non-hydrolysing)
MANRPRILLVLGTRPEAVKLAPVVRALRNRAFAEVRLLATAQHRELLDQTLAFFDLVPDLDLGLMRPDQDLADLAARMLPALAAALAAERPDLVLAQGDTTTVLCAALCAFWRRIPFGHVEAGLRSGDTDDPFPEEMNRVLAGRLASIHFAPTAGARDNLLREGVPGDRVHVTGNPVVDALLSTVPRTDPERFRPEPGRRLLLVTAHRRENFGHGLEQICAAVRELAGRPDVSVLFPVHPNPNVAGAAERALGGAANVRLSPPLDYPSMVAAMRASHFILTDSGGVQEEAPSLGKPVLVLRKVTERPEGVAAGAARLVGTERARIVAAATGLLDDAAAHAAMASVPNPYGDGKAGERIAELVGAFLRR